MVLFVAPSCLTERCFVRNFWPSPISHRRLQGMYESVIAREKEKAAKVAAAAASKT